MEQGVREGRLLLHDWLVILTAQYNEAYKLAQYKNGSSVTAQIDVAFSQCPELQPLPRLVFALLRNPLLLFHEEGVHPDYRIYLQCLSRYLMLKLISTKVFKGFCYRVLTISFELPDERLSLVCLIFPLTHHRILVATFCDMSKLMVVVF